MADIRILLDDELKKDAEKVLKDIDLTTSQAIRMFLKQVVKIGGLPFNPYEKLSKKTDGKKKDQSEN